MRHCPDCDTTKPLDDFYVKDGKPRAVCKPCWRERSKAYNRTHRERLAENKRRWNEAHPEAAKRRRKTWRANHLEQAKVQRKLLWAVESGQIKRPSRCERCSAEGHLHAHHDDYLKPYDVRWLCPVCHMAEHPVAAVL